MSVLFQLTDEQRALRAGVRQLLDRRFGRAALRAAVDAPGRLDRGLWRALGAAGFFALRLPEAEGGVGLGLPEAVLVFEEAGRALVPGPLVATHLAAGSVPGAAAGETVVAAVDGELVEWLDAADVVLGDTSGAVPLRSLDPLTPLHRLPAAPKNHDPSTNLTAAPAAGPLSGPLAVPGAGPPAVPVVGPPVVPVAGPPAVPVAGPPAVPVVGPPAVPVAGPPAVPVVGPPAVPVAGPPADSVPGPPVVPVAGPPADPVAGRPAVPVPGPPAGPSADRLAVLLTAAEQLGTAVRVGELAVQHARSREQFGRPVGAFQAVQHLCADLLVRAETARVAVYAAAVTADPADIAAARLLADEAAVRGARDCLQVHGGMGFTWEADVHLHLKRAWVRAQRGGGGTQSEELLAARLVG